MLKIDAKDNYSGTIEQSIIILGKESLFGPGPHLPPLPFQPPHSFLSPLCSHLKTTFL